VPLVAALFFGLQCAVLVLVVEALLRVAKRALRGGVPWAVAGAAFAALFLFRLPFPLVVLGGGAARRAAAGALRAALARAAKDGPPALLDALLAREPGRIARLGGRGAAGGVRGAGALAPAGRAAAAGGRRVRRTSRGSSPRWRSSPSAAPTPCWPTSRRRRWSTTAGCPPDQMLTGLGLAETTPGPLILVLQFVGFLAGHAAAGGGFWGGRAGALLTLG
jgi:chromate transporter